MIEPSIFRDPVLTARRADGRAYDRPGREWEASASVSHGEGASALAVQVRLEPDLPRFKIQSGFPRQEAVAVELPLPAGTPLLALYQHKDWWHRPAFVTGPADIPARTQLLLWREEGRYHVLLAVCGDDYRGDFRAGDNGVRVALSSNQDGMMDCRAVAAVYAAGEDPYRCCRNAVALALERTGRPVLLREDQAFPAVFEKLGWCTWDAFYQDVDEKGILEKMEELREKRLPLGWVLIDDGWSPVDRSRQELLGLGADKEKFPGGLSATVKTLRDSYKIKRVGVWQAAMGYWNGVAKDSPAHRALGDSLRRLSDGRLVPDPARSFPFWDRWHRELARQGVSFVKIDEQSATSLFFGGEETYGSGSRQMLAGLRGSAALHFGGGLINCMGTASQELWNHAGGALLRSSDDFVPDAANGFAEHCLQNAYFALLQGQLSWGDWDMFWSGHGEAARHSMLRAVSGGPVYTSDKVGETDPAPLLPLMLDDGTLLRCRQVGMPTRDCLLEDPVTGGAPLKIFNRWGEAVLVAAFHLWDQERPAAGVIDPGQAGAPPGDWLLYDRQAGAATRLGPGEGYPFALEPRGAAIYLLLPLRGDLVPIGLLDKYLSVAGVAHHSREPGRHTVVLRQGGDFGFWCRTPPKAVLVDGEPAAVIAGEQGMCRVECPGKRGHMPAVTILL